MTKGERTRQLIVERAMPLFNTRGFSGASLNDLIRETGLEKGGIYNHFHSKEEIALAAFDHAVGLVAQRFGEAIGGKERALDRLLAIVDVFRDLAADQPLVGGCPVLNTAIEADDVQTVARLDRLAGGFAVSELGDGSGEFCGHLIKRELSEATAFA